MQPIANLSAISKNYDLFLLDLWGVVHDGSHLYPGVHETLEKLKADGKKVIFISNAPRRSHKVKAVLKGLGVEEDLYLDAVSSGEVGYQWLAGNIPPPAGGRLGGGHSCADANNIIPSKPAPTPALPLRGREYFYIGPSKDADVLDGLDYVRTDDVKQADFLLNVGFGSEEQTTNDFSMLLRAAKSLSLSMLCLNPDLEVVKITGERFPCAGVIGREYERMGGAVTWFGKPYTAIYDYCEAEAHVDKSRILAVGDSLETDIPGGQHYGVDTLLITGGILKHHTREQVQEMCMKLGLRPTYVAASLG